MKNIKQRVAEWAVKQLQASGRTMDFVSEDRAKWTNWNVEAAVQHGYKASLWAYAAINKKAKAAASVPWYVYRRNSEGNYERIENHPLQTLIDKPNPFTSRNNMIERLIMQLDLTGNSIFQIITLGNVPVELWNLNPDKVEPIPDPEEFIKFYEVKPASRSNFMIPAAEILHVMYIDPGNAYWGISPLQVAAKTVDTDIEAVNWNKIALQNRAVSDGIFSVPQPLSDMQYQELRKQVREQHQGARNARAPWILGGGATWQQMSLSPADMDFIEGKRMNREEICAAFQVPPPLVGILDKANYSNMQEARRVFWLDTIIPLLDDLKESFNRALTPYFGDDIVLDYDTSSVEALAENVNEKIDAASKLFAMGLPFNAINQRLDLGFDEIEGGETGYLPAALLPAGEIRNYMSGSALPAASGPGDPEPDPEPDPGEKRLKKKAPIRFKGFNLKTEEQKAAYWLSLEKERRPWDLKFNRAALQQFEKERKAIVKAFQKSGDIEEALKVIKPEEWRKLYIQQYREIIAAFGNQAYDAFKSHYHDLETKDFNPYSAYILDYISRVAGEKIVQITDHTMELTRNIIKQNEEEEHTIDTLASILEREFEEYHEHRAWRIARTEVSAASNYGTYAAAEEASQEVGDLAKEWIDSRDSRVRDTHKQGVGVGGEIVPFYSKFSNGLLYPGDMANGSAKEVIHCRCAVAYKPLAEAYRE